MLGVTTGGNPLVGVDRERVHGLSHWKKYQSIVDLEIMNVTKWNKSNHKMWRKKRRGLTKTKDELGLDSAMHGLQQRFTKQTLDFWHSHLNYANCNCCKTALLENNSRICGSNIYAPIQLEPILCIFCNFEIEGLLKWFSVDIVLEELYQKLRAKINRPEIVFLWLLQKM